jgi:hypothetical protein
MRRTGETTMTATQMKAAIETLMKLEKQITRMVTLRPGHTLDPDKLSELCLESSKLNREIQRNIDLMYQGAAPDETFTERCSYCRVDLNTVHPYQLHGHKDGQCEPISDEEMEAFYETLENAQTINDVIDMIDARHN